MEQITVRVDIAKAAIEHAKNNGQNVVILDTAGRLQIDESMMQELVDVKEAAGVTPDVARRRCDDWTRSG